VNIRLGNGPLEALLGALLAFLMGLLNALPIGVVVYLAIRLALPRELFTKGHEKADCENTTQN